MLLGADAVTSLEKGGTIYVRSLEDTWALIGDVAGFKYWCEYYLPGFLADAIKAVLRIPGWAFTGVIGVVMAFIFGRRAHH
jgi:hypothetical protein